MCTALVQRWAQPEITVKCKLSPASPRFSLLLSVYIASVLCLIEATHDLLNSSKIKRSKTFYAERSGKGNKSSFRRERHSLLSCTRRARHHVVYFFIRMGLVTRSVISLDEKLFRRLTEFWTFINSRLPKRKHCNCYEKFFLISGQ